MRLTVQFYFEKIEVMQLFHIMNGAYLGFYQERGGTVFISGYRTVTERQWVCRMVTEEFRTPKNMVRMHKWIPGHYETYRFWVPETTEIKKRIVEEHYEKRTETTPAHWGTREYWLDPHVEIQYRYEGEPGLEAGRAGWVAYEVEIPGCWVERRIWFPAVTRTYTVLVPEHEEEYSVVVPGYHESREVWIDIREVEYWVDIGSKLVTEEHEVCEWEDVEVERPIYSYYNQEDEYDLISRERGPVMMIVGEPQGDLLQLKIIESGDIIDVEAKYIGLATQVDLNQYVAPAEEKP